MLNLIVYAVGFSSIVTCVPTSFSPSDAELNDTEIIGASFKDEELIFSTAEPQHQIGMGDLMNRLTSFANQVVADRRHALFRYNELLALINNLRSENAQLRKEKHSHQSTIDQLNKRIIIIEERWNMKNWKEISGTVNDLRHVLDDLANKFKGQTKYLMRLQQNVDEQRKYYERTSKVFRKDYNNLQRQFHGYSTMTFVFAQQTSKAINTSESRLKKLTQEAIHRSENIAERLRNRLDHVSDRANVALLRLDLWNTTRNLKNCKKSARDNDQDNEIKRLRREESQNRRLLRHIYNRTSSMELILFDNNRITNGLTEFKQRALATFEKLTANVANIAKTLPQDCSIVHHRGNRLSGVTAILPNYAETNLRAVQCLFSDSDGWTIIQNREKLDIDFNRKWLEYEKGFGNVRGDYWLGLEVIHNLVSSGNWKLRLDMWDVYGHYYYAFYTHFKIHNRDSNYQLEVDGYHGNASDTLSPSSGTGFSTSDYDADSTVVHCARFEEAGWWMRHCHDSNLNGKEPFGIIWFYKPTKDYLTLVRTRMLIAPLTDRDMSTTQLPTTLILSTSSNKEMLLNSSYLMSSVAPTIDQQSTADQFEESNELPKPGEVTSVHDHRASNVTDDGSQADRFNSSNTDYFKGFEKDVLSKENTSLSSVDGGYNRTTNFMSRLSIPHNVGNTKTTPAYRHIEKMVGNNDTFIENDHTSSKEDNAFETDTPILGTTPQPIVSPQKSFKKNRMSNIHLPEIAIDMINVDKTNMTEETNKTIILERSNLDLIDKEGELIADPSKDPLHKSQEQNTKSRVSDLVVNSHLVPAESTQNRISGHNINKNVGKPYNEKIDGTSKTTTSYKSLVTSTTVVDETSLLSQSAHRKKPVEAKDKILTRIEDALVSHLQKQQIADKRRKPKDTK